MRRSGRTGRAPGRSHRVRWRVNVDALERARVLRAWSQRDLARAAHVDPGTLGDLLAEKRVPNLGTVRAICAALELEFSSAIQFPSSGPASRAGDG